MSGQNEDDETYEVDYIIDHRVRGGRYEYLIKWKGYDKSDASWETEEAFNDPQPVERYFKLILAKKQTKKVSVNMLLTHHMDGLTVRVCEGQIFYHPGFFTR